MFSNSSIDKISFVLMTTFWERTPYVFNAFIDISFNLMITIWERIYFLLIPLVTFILFY